MAKQKHRHEYELACQLICRLADKLLPHLGAVDCAGALIGTAVNVLVSAIGADLAVRYLRDLAGEIEIDNHTPKVN